MRDFSETVGNEIDTSDMEQPTNWMKLPEIVGQKLVVLRANKGKSQWGPKYYIHFVLDGDPDAVEYTASFPQYSAVYVQLETLEADEEAYPFRCRLEKSGKTYKLAGAGTEASGLSKGGPAKPVRKPF